jgi:hypothetical protein
MFKRPKTATAMITCEKTDLPFMLIPSDNVDSDTEQRTQENLTPKYKDFIRQLPIYLAKSIILLLDAKTLYKCKYVSTYWRKMVTEVEDETEMTNMLHDDMMLLQVTTLFCCIESYDRSLEENR